VIIAWGIGLSSAWYYGRGKKLSQGFVTPLGFVTATHYTPFTS
jgi:hypothetical protein